MKTKENEGRCPNCGYCRHCGRGNPVWPVYPLPWTLTWPPNTPYWPYGPVWITLPTTTWANEATSTLTLTAGGSA